MAIHHTKHHVTLILDDKYIPVKGREPARVQRPLQPALDRAVKDKYPSPCFTNGPEPSPIQGGACPDGQTRTRQHNASGCARRAIGPKTKNPHQARNLKLSLQSSPLPRLYYQTSCREIHSHRQLADHRYHEPATERQPLPNYRFPSCKC